jgi:hypothetical protein
MICQAMLIASARPLTGLAVVPNYGLLPLPFMFTSYSNASVLDGYGRVALENVIFSDVCAGWLRGFSPPSSAVDALMWDRQRHLPLHCSYRRWKIAH